MDKKTLAFYLDFANHHQNATEDDIGDLCQKVLQYGFHSAFVNPYHVLLARQIIADKATVGTVVSFPLGQEATEIKIAQSLWAVKNGATELDVSMNIGIFKQEMSQYHLEAGRTKMVPFEKTLGEMKAIVSQVKNMRSDHDRSQDTAPLVKFIIETGHLTDEEIKKASELVLLSGADFVKTCSGYGPRGATIHDVELIKPTVGDKIKIKVAGGITTYQQAIDFINAGVSRIGTSHAVEIVEGIKL